MSSDLSQPGVAFVIPTDARRATGPVSVWLTATGLAGAAEEIHGNAWLLTPSGVHSPVEAETLATTAPRRPRSQSSARRFVPQALGTLRKDVRSLQHARRFRKVGTKGPWEGAGLAWVWHHHEPFHRNGFDIGRAFDCPVVVFVDAPIVWEARKWGVRRPGWGALLERFGESPQIRGADLVACVTEEVADEALRLGAPSDRVVITPCAVDIERFNTFVDGAGVRARNGLEDRTVVGWVGTFHKFHGLDLLLDAYAALERERDDIALMLVGDGQDRPRVESRVGALGLRHVVMTGTVPHAKVPEHIAAMDVAVLVDPGTTDFHYSPLKLKEYMACGRAIVAPSSGQVQRYITAGEHAVLVEPGNIDELLAALRSLSEDPQRRATLGRAAHDLVQRTGTWRHQIQTIDASLRAGVTRA